MLNVPKQSLKPFFRYDCLLRGAADETSMTVAEDLFSFGYGSIADAADDVADFFFDWSSIPVGGQSFIVKSTTKKIRVFLSSDGAYGTCQTVSDVNPDFCSTATCPENSGCCDNCIGACCKDGSCSNTTLGACANIGGGFNGCDTLCYPDLCEQPTGACCTPDDSGCASCETCSVTTQKACEDGGGTYQGNKTECQVDASGNDLTCPTDGCDCQTGLCCQYDSRGLPIACFETTKSVCEGLPNAEFTEGGTKEDCEDSCTGNCQDGSKVVYCCRPTGGCISTPECGTCPPFHAAVEDCKYCSDDPGRWECFQQSDDVDGACVQLATGGSYATQVECEANCECAENCCCNPDTGQCYDNTPAKGGTITACLPDYEAICCGNCDLNAGRCNPVNPFTGIAKESPGLTTSRVSKNQLKIFSASIEKYGDTLVFAQTKGRSYPSDVQSNDAAILAGLATCNICNINAGIINTPLHCPPGEPAVIAMEYDLRNLCQNDEVKIAISRGTTRVSIQVYVKWFGYEAEFGSNQYSLIFNDSFSHAQASGGVIPETLEYLCQAPCGLTYDCYDSGHGIYTFSPALSPTSVPTGFSDYRVAVDPVSGEYDVRTIDARILGIGNKGPIVWKRSSGYTERVDSYVTGSSTISGSLAEAALNDPIRTATDTNTAGYLSRYTNTDFSSNYGSGCTCEFYGGCLPSQEKLGFSLVAGTGLYDTETP